MKISHVPVLAASAVSFAVCLLAPPASAASPCQLVTSAQIDSAVGASVGAGQPIGNTGCQWLAGTPNLRVSITIMDAANWAMTKTPLPNITKTPAPGLGDDAFYTVVQTASSLSVKKGNSYIVVRVYGIVDVPKQEAAEKTIALDALPNF